MGWMDCYPETTYTTSTYDYPIFIKQKLAEKRRLRKKWHLHRTPATNYSAGLRKSLNSSFMTTTITTSKHSSTVLTPRPPLITPCGKLQKDLKVIQTSTPLRTPQGTWARTNADKAQAFANHLASVFQPHPPEPHSLPKDTLTSFLETPFQLEPPYSTPQMIRGASNIKNLPPKKYPGYDLMTGKILKELPTLCIQYSSRSLANPLTNYPLTVPLASYPLSPKSLKNSF
jgi:hypothetical protein